MSNCEKYFAYCGPGIFIPIKHIQPGEEKILEERYLKEKEKDPKKRGKDGKGNSSIETEKDKTKPPTKAAKKTPLQHLRHPQLTVVNRGPSKQRKL